MDTSYNSAGPCRFCGNYHGVQCPSVKAIEYHPDGTVKRVEFTTAADMPTFYRAVGEPFAGLPAQP